MYDCGCEGRKQRLNSAYPRLGDHVETILQPVAPIVKPLLSGEVKMTELLKPDLKAIVWLAVGAFVVPYILKLVK